MKKYEYRIVSIPSTDPTEVVLNEMGDDGWKAIDFYRSDSFRNVVGTYTMITFIREKETAAPAIIYSPTARNRDSRTDFVEVER